MRHSKTRSTAFACIVFRAPILRMIFRRNGGLDQFIGEAVEYVARA
jgi:hypothetical protein